jgi:hypothetical protein
LEVWDIPSKELLMYRTVLSKFCYASTYKHREELCQNISCSFVNLVLMKVEPSDIIKRRIQGYYVYRVIIQLFLLKVLSLDETYFRLIEYQRKTLSSNYFPISQHSDSVEALSFEFLYAFQELKAAEDSLMLHASVLTALGTLFSSNFSQIARLSDLGSDGLNTRRTANQRSVGRDKIVEFYYHFPELLKLSIEISHELLDVLANNGDQYSSLIFEIREYMLIIFRVVYLLVHPSQNQLISVMWKEFFQSVCLA